MLMIGWPAQYTNLKSFFAMQIKVIRMQDNIDGKIARDVLLEICQNVFLTEFEDVSEKDLFLGLVAEAALFMQNTMLFYEALEQLTTSFDREAYWAMGEVLYLEGPLISEDW